MEAKSAESAAPETLGKRLTGSTELARNALGLPHATVTSLSDLATNLNFVVFGLILVTTMLLRPQGLVPSRQRQEELTKGTHGGEVVDVRGVA